MKVTIIQTTEIIIVDTIICESSPESGDYDYLQDSKWIEFCKKHNFNPKKDYKTKFYDLYLRLCGEGLI